MVDKTSTADGQVLDGTSTADQLTAENLNVIMNGFAGDDNYVVNELGAVINELANGGWDTIFSNVDFFSIANLTNIEELRASGGTNSQTIIGNTGSNVMADSGLTNSADYIESGAGNDTIYSESGADTLVGGTGNDRYLLRDSAAIVVEQAGEGIDAIYVSMAAYSIENLLQIENLAVRNNDNHTLTGNVLDNVITGANGNDTLNGGEGNDRLSGIRGNDTLIGGNGNDTYILSYYLTGDIIRITEAAGGGTDTVRSALPNYSLYNKPNVENLEAFKVLHVHNYVLTGNSLANQIKGLSGADTLVGLEGNDVLLGGSGNDKLHGGTANDTLVGGRGADRLVGGTGKDVFDFDSVLDSRFWKSGRDVITDFVKGDRIDLSTIDARTSVAGNNAYSFIGAADFSKKAGQLRYTQDNKAGSSNDRTIVHGDVNGDGKADFQIELVGLVSLKAVDFIL